MDNRDIIRTIAGQLESERFLGGRWLPFAKPLRQAVSAKPAASKGETVSDSTKAAPSPPAARKGVVIEQKRARLEQINSAIAQCRKCDLYKSRTNVVPGQGDPDARIVFVGEAPGGTEDAQGLAFVGRAGKLLTNIIEAMGLSRQDVYICNILKCRPPNNRDPQTTEIIACTDYLYEQLDVISPEIIVALGAHAAKTLLSSTEPIGRLRGRFHQYQPGPFAAPIKLLPTYHPAYLLRNYSQDNRLRVWQDMQTVLKELGLPIPKGRAD